MFLQAALVFSVWLISRLLRETPQAVEYLAVLGIAANSWAPFATIIKSSKWKDG